MSLMGFGGHVHESLYDLEGKPLFYDSNAKYNMSVTMKQFLAGQLKYAKAFLVMSAHTINSYARLVPGAWAPTLPTWSYDNRTASIRLVPGNEKSHHLEYRIPGADANPYLVGAAMLASGMLGIEQKLELPEETKANCYEAGDKFTKDQEFASNLRDSYRNFSESKEAKEWFGDEFVKHFTLTRDWEVRQYERTINDWQMRRYFEII